MRAGVAFPHRHPHERTHLAPLMERLADLLVTPPREAAVVVQADTRPPVRGAWNVQVFHGLGDKGYTGNPLFLQRGRLPRVRTVLNRPLAALHLPAPFLRPPRRPGRRRSRYQEVNAYGKRFEDHFRSILRGLEVGRFGHVALNELEGLRPDPHGPVVWLPTWDNRAFLGGAGQSSLPAFAAEVARAAHEVPFTVKYHPLTVAHHQAARARRLLASAPGVDVVPADTDPYRLLRGARAVLTDSSSLGFEAYCLGFPVAVAKPPRVHLGGLHGELEERTVVLHAGRPGLSEWAHDPPPPSDTKWARDLLDPPARRRNDAFAAHLRQKVVERVSGARW